MSARVALSRSPFHVRGLKEAVVFLLLIDFAVFAHQDWLAATALSGTGAGLLEWTHAFATTLDEAAWFTLLFLFEFELRLLSRRAGRGALDIPIRVARAICCLVVAHTVFANARNLDALIAGSSAIDSGELGLAWVALLESLAWLAVILSLFLDERDLASGRPARARVVRGLLKFAGYFMLLFAAAWWARAGHYLYAWDECLWVGAFGGLDLGFRRFRRADAAVA